MKFLVACFLICIGTVFLSCAVFAQPLNGVYGGHATSTDPSNPILQLARFTFVNGTLTDASEIILFPGETSPCPMEAGGAGAPTGSSLPYRNFSQWSGQSDGTFFAVTQFGCPQGSNNLIPETLIIIPEKGGAEFDYMEYGNPFSNLPQAFIGLRVLGHAIRK